MIKELITKDWNAEPNAPYETLSVDGTTVILEFFLNYHLFDDLQENDKARVTFLNCHKYFFGSTNMDSYYMGKHRYKNDVLPWGEFYMLDTNWEVDFPADHITLIDKPNIDKQNHFIFFFRDSTFECVAERYQLGF